MYLIAVSIKNIQIISFDLPFMMNILALSSLALATLHMAVAPVSAHGYVSHPPSRQARCRDDQVPGCGDVKYEPQSVEGPKGSYKCNGDGPRFPELNDEALWENHFFSVTPDVDSLLFTWTLPAPHRTASWEYFVLTDDNAMLAWFNGVNATPSSPVEHLVPLDYYTGRQTILARWNIGDTSAAFYSCVDLFINPSYTAMAMTDAAAPQLPIGIPLAVPGHPGQ
jgi:chitin-binding protein